MDETAKQKTNSSSRTLTHVARDVRYRIAIRDIVLNIDTNKNDTSIGLSIDWYRYRPPLEAIATAKGIEH